MTNTLLNIFIIYQGVFGYQMYIFTPVYYGKYVFPNWANLIGIFIGLSTLAPLPLYFIYCLYKGPVSN